MIVLILVPGFYAAVEQADNPALRGRPVVVGADPAKRGTVTSASREARSRGVGEGMEMRRALELCPEAVIRPTRLERYREVAAELRALLRAETDRIEELGLEGAFLELEPGSDELARAAELCVRVQAELGIAAVAGIAPTRFVAHLAARHAGPGGIRQVTAEEVRPFLAPYPVTEIWGLGPATAEKLGARGVHTIATLAAVDLETLAGIVGRGAALILEYARGEDHAPLRPKPQARTLSQERTLEEPAVDLRSLATLLETLAEKLERGLVRERRAARTVTVGLSFVDGTRVTRSSTLDDPSAAGAIFAEAAQALLSRTQAGARPVRRVRLAVSGLVRAEAAGDARQLRLF
ncbi:MAG TPA: DNA polymerase IV [Myxococcota bacterium]|nr:DNA polymerase IV [Myxococcota bacterium]